MSSIAIYNGQIVTLNNEIGISYELETLALLSRMITQPTTELANLIDKTITDLKNDGLWELMDFMYFFNVHDVSVACLNWIKDAHNINVIGGADSPTWEEKIGFTGHPTGIDSYLKTNYIPSSDGVNYVLDSASGGLFCVDASMAGTAYELHGAWALTGGTACRFQISFNNGYSSQGECYAIINGTIGTLISGWDNSTGLLQMSRSNSSGVDVYINDTSTRYLVSASYATPVDNEIYFLALKASSVDQYHVRDTIGFVYAGGALTADQHSSVYNIMTYFNDNVASTF